MLRHYKRPLAWFAIAFLCAKVFHFAGESDCTAALFYALIGFADIVCKTKSLLRAYLAAEEEKNYGKNPQQFHV